jgi:hypothetical protein
MSEIFLSPHFTLDKFTYSETAIRLGKPIVVDREGPIFQALTAWCENIGEPLWNKWGDAIEITSGYRPEWLNSLIGGAKGSQHEKGEAVDSKVRGVPVREVSLWVANSGLPFDQLIHEYDSWTHISFTTAQTARRSILTAAKVNGHTAYITGITA